MISFILAQAQQPSPEDVAAIEAISNLISLISYFLGAFLCWKVYEKCGVENAWFAWIPILGLYVNFQAGDEEQPLLWTILMFIPCINIVSIIKLLIAWIRIFQKLGKSPWLLLLALIPCVWFILLGYLAFG
ncbi:DUF5684 domain-containing protein [Crocosphaera sp.]|uniref:DUF5684 domain-containing protein n=1 Tax=Crocosphaera sp. TaxID=2729996 RepID=UPI003F1E8629|nr:DUF5684 domain-containing protein [Crocosphaera sp.]